MTYPPVTIPFPVVLQQGAVGTLLTPATGSVSDASVATNAAIQASKMNHFHKGKFAQPNTTATSETKEIHYATAAGNVVDFFVGCIVAPLTTATVTFDLKKNGTSILSSVVTLTNSNTARVSVPGSVTSSAYVAGDLFEVTTVAAASGGTLPSGIYAQATFNEAPA